MALVLAVLVAIAATTTLVLQRRALGVCRREAASAGARADAAEAAGGRAHEALEAAEAQARTLGAEREAAATSAEEQRVALWSCEQRLAEAEDGLGRCADELAQAQAGLVASAGALERARAAAGAERARAEELEAAAEALAVERRDGPPSRAAGAEDAALVEPCWRLLLARVERQWAQAVGAGEVERGVAPGPHDEQLSEAVGRELERLREEVGLDTDVVRTGAMGDVHPLLVLLAAGELSALAAPHSERVAVELGDQLVVVAEGWSSDAAAADRLRAALADTGLSGEVVAGDDSLRIVVGHRQGAPAST